MKIKRFNDLIIKPIKFKNSKGVDKIVYPSVMIKNVSIIENNILSLFRKEMNDLMFNQGFSTPPKFIDSNGNIIEDHLRYTVENPCWVFFVEEKNLEKANEIANKYNFDFYIN